MIKIKLCPYYYIEFQKPLTHIKSHQKLYTVSQKNIPNIFDCNLKKDYRILIILRENIPKTTGHHITM